jgi:ubiquinone/menaquinone biosynthesis C-methylase UbiE
MVDRLIEYLPREAGSGLELGCGTGNLSLRLVRELPHADLTFVDASSDMIELSRARISGGEPSTRQRLKFVTRKFEDLDFPDESFDLVVSSISLHHVDDKRTLYERLHAMLRPAGRFCFADQLRGEPESNHEENWRRWLEFCREPGHCTPDEIASLLEHAAAHDHYTTLAQHFELLSQAGFCETDCVWKNWMWGIVTATRARSR